MKPMIWSMQEPLRGHALTTLDGVFLGADDPFCETVARNVATLQGLTILEITHPGDRLTNHDRLDALRRLGEPFEISKRYVRADGSLVLVKNHVSVFCDGAGPERLVASVTAVSRPGAPLDERELFGIANHLLRDRSLHANASRQTVRTSGSWSILLAVYVLEQQGAPTLLRDVCRLAGANESAGYLEVLSLMSKDVLLMDRPGSDLSDSSVVLTTSGRQMMTEHLRAVLRGDSVAQPRSDRG